MDNKHVARVLIEVSQLLELHEENEFKIRAYQNAARAIEGLGESVERLVAERRLLQVPGIGKAIAQKIEELVTTRRLQYYDELRAEFPASLFELLRIPNLGPKKIKVLYDQLGIKDVKELEEACAQNKLTAIRGFGKKTQEKILQSIRAYSAERGRQLLSKALPVADQIAEYLQTCKYVDRVAVAGSVRRRKEIVNDLDFIVTSRHPRKVSDFFLKMPFLNTVIAKGDTKTSVQLDSIGLQVDMRVVKPEEFACALHHFTGSKEHNVAMRGHARKLGYKINEYGIEKGDRVLKLSSEEELYALFGMDYIPPEIREGLGEVETALQKKIPALVEASDIQGLFHVHSVWSDGHNTLEQMVVAAKERGYRYVGISEHSKTATYAYGLDEKRLRQHGEEIERLRDQYPEIQILKGSEVDILPDGSLDYTDEVLATLDFVIASVHSGFRMEEPQMTERICRALSNPYVNILGHATGRLLLNRRGYAVNLDKVLETAAKHNKIIEINANPHRLDLDWRYVRKAVEMGIALVINPDAHYIHEYDHMKYGVAVARKGWASADNIINTRAAGQVLKFFNKHRPN